MHADEAIHTVKFADLWLHGEYRYDPHDFHGPTLYDLTLPVVALHGADRYAETDETTYRIVPAIAGAALLLLLWPAGTALGRPAALAAGVLTAVSPAMVFYSRYYIQEMLLVLFTLAAILAGWRYARTRRIGWAILAGACLGLMHATKETAVVAWFAMAAGLLAVAVPWGRILRRGRKVDAPPPEAPAAGPVEAAETLRRRRRTATLLGLALLTGLVVSAATVSVGFREPMAIVDSWATYGNYLHRAGGAGMYDKPAGYYLGVLLGRDALGRILREPLGPYAAFSEAYILLLALVGGAAVALRRGLGRADVGLLRFLAVYTVVLLAAYSLIPYKTPWTILGALHGAILLAGVGFAAVVRAARRRALQTAVAAVLLLPAVQLAWQAYPGTLDGPRAALAAAGWRLPAPPMARLEGDPRNPYTYSQPVTDVLNLRDRLDALAAASGKGRDLPILVVAPAEDAWPLPFYLRRFGDVGYFQSVPERLDAPVVLAAEAWSDAVAQRLAGEYQAQYFGLRPNVHAVLYVRRDVWDAFLAAQAGARAARAEGRP